MRYQKHALVLLCMFVLALPAHARQRGGGGRGAGAPGQDNLQLIELMDRLTRSGTTSSAWWTNTALVTRLGITDDQKARIERTFENHRPRLETARATLEKEEAQLAQLLDAESFDSNAALTQAFRVVQSRSEMERENTIMTVEMRRHLTRAQWIQLPQPSLGLTIQRSVVGGGGRGTRGQQ